jgi:hypothetical protein
MMKYNFFALCPLPANDFSEKPPGRHDGCEQRSRGQTPGPVPLWSKLEGSVLDLSSSWREA